MKPNDALLREIVILEQRLYQATCALNAIGSLLHVDVRAGSVSAMKTSLRDRARSNKDPAQPDLPF